MYVLYPELRLRLVVALINRCLSWVGLTSRGQCHGLPSARYSSFGPEVSHSHTTPELARSCFFPRTCQAVLLHSLQCRRPSRQRYRVVLMVAGIVERLFQPCFGSFSPFGFASTATFDLKVVGLLLVSRTVSSSWANFPFMPRGCASSHHEGREPGRGMELESGSLI